ncbi:MAG TPA: hydroxymethylglutaryl-CoA lyase [Candidatus Limnocylindria bacterium]|nr:hydroxymethylglutaryl-CoA lyase [Candidatus Limnocylindria bacterium]
MNLPERIRVVEVGPRDGLQSAPKVLDTETKIQLIERLAQAGLTVIEATSFVSPKAVPQLADADEVLRRLRRAKGVRYPVLVPNEKGLERALAAGATEIAVFASASEAYSRKNLAHGREEVLAILRPVVRRAKDAGLFARGYLSMVIADPWDGPTPVAFAVDDGRRLLDLGCDEVSLGDTVGAGTPVTVDRLIRGFIAAGVTPERLAVHLHDTHHQALANVLTVLGLGVTTIDASVAGLGGSTVVEDPHGNLATEDLLFFCDGNGIATGIDRNAVVEIGAWLRRELVA